MTLLGSYDPYLMLFNGHPLADDVVELLQIDINQYWLKTQGKTRLFSYFDYLYSDLGHKKSVTNEKAIFWLLLFLLMVAVVTRLTSLLHTWATNYQRIREEMNETADDMLAIRAQHLQNRMASLTGNQQQLEQNEENE